MDELNSNFIVGPALQLCGRSSETSAASLGSARSNVDGLAVSAPRQCLSSLSPIQTQALCFAFFLTEIILKFLQIFSKALFQAEKAAVLTCADKSSSSRQKTATYIAFPDQNGGSTLSMHRVVSEDSFCFVSVHDSSGTTLHQQASAMHDRVRRLVDDLPTSKYFPLAGVLTSSATQKVEELVQAAQSGQQQTSKNAKRGRSINR